MIKTYNVEDLTIEQLDRLIEEGIVFHVVNKTTISPGSRVAGTRDTFWGIGDNNTVGLRNTNKG